tara:strand:- start:6024 stop:6317 length:294 start_codon:yes stop_codon:yes gene_type:complete
MSEEIDKMVDQKAMELSKKLQGITQSFDEIPRIIKKTAEEFKDHPKAASFFIGLMGLYTTASLKMMQRRTHQLIDWARGYSLEAAELMGKLGEKEGD